MSISKKTKILDAYANSVNLLDRNEIFSATRRGEEFFTIMENRRKKEEIER